MDSTAPLTFFASSLSLVLTVPLASLLFREGHWPCCYFQPSQSQLPLRPHSQCTLQRALAQRLSRCTLIVCLHIFVRTPRTFSSFCPKHLAQGQVHAAAAKSLQSCPTLYDPMDCSPPGSPVPGILQARTLEWVAISFSTGT